MDAREPAPHIRNTGESPSRLKLRLARGQRLSRRMAGFSGWRLHVGFIDFGTGIGPCRKQILDLSLTAAA